MKKHKRTPIHFDLRVAAAYAAFGTLWVAASDRVLESLVADPHRITLAQTYKGWLFVAASTLLLYLTLRREMRKRQDVEEALRGNEVLHRTLAESAQDLVFVADQDGRIRYLNRAGAEFLGWAAEGASAKRVRDVFVPETYDRYLREIRSISESGRAISFEGLISSPEDQRWFHTVLTPIRGPEGESNQVLGVAREITGRKRAEARIDLQVQRLDVLHTIDTAITSSLDLRLTLDVLLAHVTAALRVDAACVLLLESHAPMLEYAAGKGFRTNAVTRSSLRLGEGYAGKAALERKMVQIRDVAEVKGPFLAFSLLEKESFVAYYGVPLIAKGQVKGVLEIYHRSRLDPDPEWLQFLEALATDAAIAIDNAELFSDLERANTELTLAYDATLEGWGRALELRDEETEGHTRRVTEETVRLARAMQVPEGELVHIRRGSFLHDIGKIGIPDKVLLKSESLTEAEWQIMRMHPVYAFRILQPIRYLRPALDIPYCHHERWDGTGYPRGLAGEHIPLAARIFAVIDVWDALRSNRPYHSEWSEEKVREHIRVAAGSHFDPKVVEAFLKLT